MGMYVFTVDIFIKKIIYLFMEGRGAFQLRTSILEGSVVTMRLYIRPLYDHIYLKTLNFTLTLNQ